MTRRLPLLAVGAALLAAPATAAADGSASATETLTLAVRSVSIDKTAITCAPALVIPWGTCNTDAVRITNGATSSHIFVKGGPAVGSDNQPPNWTPCAPSGTGACAGSNGLPGPDQFTSFMTSDAAPGQGTYLLSSFVRDQNFPTAGIAQTQPGASADEFANTTAPYASTNPSPSFATSITWMAGP